MGNKKKKNIEPIKQLLNFTEKECEEYDISEFKKSLLALYGNNPDRLLKLRLFVQVDNKKETAKFFSQKGKESAIKKRMIQFVTSIMTNRRDNKFYEIEQKAQVAGQTVSVGAIKFHSQENVRIICREYLNGEIIIVMIEAKKKKGQKNSDDSSYNNRLEAATKIKHYYIDKINNKKFYI
jgi:hypothetical protein